MNKYRKGELVQTLADAVTAISRGQWLYEGEKVQHPGWLLSQTLFTLKIYVDHRRMWYAVENKEESIANTP